MITKWKVTIKDLRKCINNAPDTDAGARITGSLIYNILNSQRYRKYFSDYDIETAECLEDFNSVTSKEELNELLYSFYDYCDNNGIWIDF